LTAEARSAQHAGRASPLRSRALASRRSIRVAQQDEPDVVIDAIERVLAAAACRPGEPAHAAARL
jgi:hypothetical protein